MYWIYQQLGALLSEQLLPRTALFVLGIANLILVIKLERVARALQHQRAKLREEGRLWRETALSLIETFTKGETEATGETMDAGSPADQALRSEDLPKHLKWMVNRFGLDGQLDEVKPKMEKQDLSVWSLAKKLGLWRAIWLTISGLWLVKILKSVYDDFAPLFSEKSNKKDCN